MKILIYSNEFRTPKETNRGLFTTQLAKALNNMAEVIVVCPLPWCPELSILKSKPEWYATAGVPLEGEHEGIKVYYPKYPMMPKLSGTIQPLLQAIRSYFLIRRIHKKNKIDIINAHWIYPDGVAAVIIGKLLNIPVMLTALGCDINLYGRYRFRRIQILWALNNSSAITGVSKSLVREMVDMGANKDISSYTPNGVDTEFFSFAVEQKEEFRRKLGLDLNTKYLLYVGRLSEEKGARYLVKAVSLLAASKQEYFRVIIAGNGDQYEVVNDIIKKNKLEGQVTMLGEVPHIQVPELMRACDIFCLASLREGMPNAVLEAQACGMPVIATNVGGLPDMITEENGILVTPGNTEELAKGILLAMNKTWDRITIAKSVEGNTWNNSARNYLRDAKRVLGK